MVRLLIFPTRSSVAKMDKPPSRTRNLIPEDQRGKPITGQALEVLRQAFARNRHPKREEIGILAEQIGFCRKKICVWFSNQRARQRFHQKVYGCLVNPKEYILPPPEADYSLSPKVNVQLPPKTEMPLSPKPLSADMPLPLAHYLTPLSNGIDYVLPPPKEAQLQAPSKIRTFYTRGSLGPSKVPERPLRDKRLTIAFLLS